MIGGNAKRTLALFAKILCILLMLNLILFAEWGLPVAAIETGQFVNEEEPAVVEEEDPSPEDSLLANLSPPAWEENDTIKHDRTNVFSTDAYIYSGQPMNGYIDIYTRMAEEFKSVADVKVDMPEERPVDQPAIPYIPNEDQMVFNHIYKSRGDKIAYLTFDDGPTPTITTDILDILLEEEIKATFFVIGDIAEKHPDIIKRQYEEGHGIANHTYSHVFSYIYKNVDNFIQELIQTETVLKSILGEDKAFRLFRFPGGSFGGMRAPFRQASNEAGFYYIDWNSLNGDAESTKILSEKILIQRMKNTVKGQDVLVILMHDAPHKRTTVNALPEIIQHLKSLGYRFDLLPLSR